MKEWTDTRRYLRNYIKLKQNDWDEVLPYAEIAINNSEGSFTGKTLFVANYQFSQCQTPKFLLHPSSKIELLQQRYQNPNLIRKQFQAPYANRRRSEI